MGESVVLFELSAAATWWGKMAVEERRRAGYSAFFLPFSVMAD